MKKKPKCTFFLVRGSTLVGLKKVPYLAVTFEEPFNVPLATIGWDVP